MDNLEWFMVWNMNNRQPRVKHPTLIEAVRESRRLSALNPNDTFVVLKAMCFHKAEVQVKEYWSK